MASKGKCHGSSFRGKKRGSRSKVSNEQPPPISQLPRCHKNRQESSTVHGTPPPHSFVLSGVRGRAGSVLVRSRRAGRWRSSRLTSAESHPSTTRDSAERSVPLRSGRTESPPRGALTLGPMGQSVPVPSDQRLLLFAHIHPFSRYTSILEYNRLKKLATSIRSGASTSAASTSTISSASSTFHFLDLRIF